MARESDIYSVSPTMMNVGLSAYIALNPVANQVGVMFFPVTGGGTLEIAGGGISSAGFGTSYNIINTGNKSTSGAVTPSLMPNGMGIPLASNGGVAFFDTMTLWGQPTVWFTSGGATSTISILYLKSSQDGS